MDISQLAREFAIHPDVLRNALDDAARLLCTVRQGTRPADKRALRGVARALEEMIERVSADEVRERLEEAIFQAPQGPDEDGFAYFSARVAAEGRVLRAIEGAQDLLAIVRAGEDFKMPAGRPRYYAWSIAIASLVEFWGRDLDRKATISGHASEPRGVKPSPLLRFVHQCMQQLGEEITEEACRTVLKNLRGGKVELPWDTL